jgi:membrane protease subunit HflK
MSNGRDNRWDVNPEGQDVWLLLKQELEPYLQKFRRNKSFLLGLLGLLVLVGIGTQSYVQLEPEEEAIILRLGKPLDNVLGPGLHFKIPWVDVVYQVPVNRQHRFEFGFRSVPGKVTVETGRASDYASESLMLTGDLMLVHVRWSMVYKIEDIFSWVFKVKDHEPTIRDISMAVMRQVVGDYSLEEVLTTKQLEIAAWVERETQAALRHKVPTGVSITEIAIKSADVPERARKAFDDLTRTLAKVQGELAEAKAEQDNVIGVARKDKSEQIGLAENKRAQVVENARGEAAAFLAKAREFQLAPEITKQWMFLSTMNVMLAGLEEKYILESQSLSNLLTHLPLDSFATSSGSQTSLGGTSR